MILIDGAILRYFKTQKVDILSI